MEVVDLSWREICLKIKLPMKFSFSPFSPLKCIVSYNFSAIRKILLPYREGLEVTDDVSIVEHLKHPVYITEGSYTNIKVINENFINILF